MPGVWRGSRHSSASRVELSTQVPKMHQKASAAEMALEKTLDSLPRQHGAFSFMQTLHPKALRPAGHCPILWKP